MPALLRLPLRVITLVIALCTTSGRLQGQGARPDSAGAVATVARFHAALAAQDSVRALSLLASDVLVLESGAIQTRAEYLSHHLGADMKAMQGAKGVRSLVRVTMLGDAAYVVSKTATPANNADGSNASEMAEIMVLSRTGDGWTIRAIHWSSRRRRT
jgi:ketosteroid isomerase-like protein